MYFIPSVLGVDELESRKTTALMAMLNSLRRFTNYSIQVLAFTRVGDGITTKPIICATGEDGTDSNCAANFFGSCIIRILPTGCAEI
jgi:hypothetical protein